MDITCAWCAEPWDVDELRHHGDDYVGDDDIAALVGGRDIRNGAKIVHDAVLSGKGCPDCGFTHRGRGPHRDQQLHELVYDGVTDEDPMSFILDGELA